MNALLNNVCVHVQSRLYVLTFVRRHAIIQMGELHLVPRTLVGMLVVYTHVFA